jgi:hypothetical protein
MKNKGLFELLRILFAVLILVQIGFLSKVGATDPGGGSGAVCDTPNTTEINPGELRSQACTEGNGGVWKYCFSIGPGPSGPRCICSDECDDCDDGTYRKKCNTPIE